MHELKDAAYMATRFLTGIGAQGAAPKTVARRWRQRRRGGSNEVAGGKRQAAAPMDRSGLISPKSLEPHLCVHSPRENRLEFNGGRARFIFISGSPLQIYGCEVIK